MTRFETATDEMLVNQIRKARNRIVFMAPGVSETVADALVNAARQQRSSSVTVILDVDEEAWRIGYGDTDGLEHLIQHQRRIRLRKHSGVRIGLLMADSVVTIWSPTPRSVDAERESGQPNAVVLDGALIENNAVVREVHRDAIQDTESNMRQPSSDAVAEGTSNLTKELEMRLQDDSGGQQDIQPGELEELVKELQENPPAPFDLARKVRVFSTRFQYVETEVQGVELTGRKIKISSFLLNSDLPGSLQDVLETQIRPYRTKEEIPFDVPCIVRGQIAYDRDQEKILGPMNQREIRGIWNDIQHRYLVRIPKFGTLIRKREMAKFRSESECYECVIKDWVKQFRAHSEKEEETLISEIVKVIQNRIQQSGRREKFESFDFKTEVRKGLTGMRVIEPRVRIIIKDVSWESSRDQEFTDALRKALPAEELEGWFEEFVAAEERR